MPEKEHPQKKNKRDHHSGNNNKNRRRGGGGAKSTSHALSWALRHAAPELKLRMTSDGYCPVKDILEHQHPKLANITSLEDHIRPVVETNDKQRFRLELRPQELYEKDPPKKWSIIALSPEQAAPVVSSVQTPTDSEKDASAHYDLGSRGGLDDATKVPLSTQEKDGLIWCVRANQGHSLKGINPEYLLQELSSEELASLTTIVHGSYFEAWRKIQESSGLSKMNRTHIHCASGLLNKTDDNGEKVISGMRASCQVYIYIDGAKCAKDSIRFFRSDNGVLLTAGVEDKGILPLRYLSHVTDKDGKILLDNRQSE